MAQRLTGRGPGRAGPLILVWALTVLLLGGVAGWLEMTYEGAPSASAPAPLVETRSARPESPPDRRPTETAQAMEDPATTAERDVQLPPPETVRESPEAGEGAAIRMEPVPDPALVESVNGRMLPVVAADGRQPWRAYRRPFLDPTRRPRVAIVLLDVGLSSESARSAIDGLPPEVSLAISPYAKEGQDLVRLARDAGHEVLLMAPMEPLRYPDNDPGPLTLLVDRPEAEMIDRLHETMSRFQGYAGLVNAMGSRFTASEEAMLPFLDELSRRGLLFMDAKASSKSVGPALATALGVPLVYNDRYIDNTPSGEEIDRQLSDLLFLAGDRGAAVGVARPLPVTIERLRLWAKTLDERGFVLAPVTALAGSQPVR